MTKTEEESRSRRRRGRRMSAQPPRRAILWCLAVVAFVALSGEGSESPSSAPDEIAATYRGGTVTFSELAQWRQAHPKSAGAGPPTLDEARRIAFAKHLAAATLERGADLRPPLSELLAEQEDAILARALRRQLDADSRAGVLDEHVEAASREYPEAFRKPERRRLRSLFQRYPTGADATARREVLERVGELRRRVVSEGADFATLAREESDSQTRFRDGLIGNVEPGELPPEVEAVAWMLGPGEVSEPLPSADGVSLLFCELVLAPVVPTAEEVRRRLRRNLELMAVRESWEALEAALRARSDQMGPGAATATEVTDRQLADEARSRGLHEMPDVQADSTWRRLDTLALDELRARVDERFEEPTAAEVREYYATHPESFQAPPEFDLLAIRFELEAGVELASYQKAMELAEDLEAGRVTFDDVAREFSSLPSAASGGALGWVPGPQLARLGANLWKTVTSLEPGEFSPVVEQDGALWILRLVALRPRRTAAFAEVSEKALRGLAQETLARLRDQIEGEVVSHLSVRLVTEP